MRPAGIRAEVGFLFDSLEGALHPDIHREGVVVAAAEKQSTVSNLVADAVKFEQFFPGSREFHAGKGGEIEFAGIDGAGGS